MFVIFVLSQLMPANLGSEVELVCVIYLNWHGLCNLSKLVKSEGTDHMLINSQKCN